MAKKTQTEESQGKGERVDFLISKNPDWTYKQIVEEFARLYPGETVSDQTIANRKKALQLTRGRSVALASGPPTKKESAPTKGGSSPTLEDVLKVKKLADEVGGLDRLAKSVEALKELGVK
jgi:hypothetical protein